MLEKDQRNNYIAEMLQFLQLVKGLPVDIKEMKESFSKTGLEDSLTVTSFYAGDPNVCEIKFSYLSDVNYDDLEDYVSDYNNKDELLREHGYDYEKTIDYYYQEVQRIKSLKVPSEFIGSVVTPDFSISIINNLVQGTITSDKGFAIVFYGYLDENKHLNTVTVSYYDSIFDIAEEYDWEFILNVDNIRKQESILASKGIEPIQKSNINFQEFLADNGLEGLYDYPVTALYNAKNALINGKISSISKK